MLIRVFETEIWFDSLKSAEEYCQTHSLRSTDVQVITARLHSGGINEIYIVPRRDLRHIHKEGTE